MACSPSRCSDTTAAKSCGAGWPIFRSSFIRDYIPRIQEVQASVYHVIRETLETLAHASSSPHHVVELFGSAGCPHTQEMREWLEWRGAEFMEYDVEADHAALDRMRALPAASAPCLCSWTTAKSFKSAGKAAAASSADELTVSPTMSACSIKVRGVVQGVGFRPFVFRLARANTFAGWVFNGEEGVEIFLEGADQATSKLSCSELKAAPPAGRANCRNRNPRL